MPNEGLWRAVIGWYARHFPLGPAASGGARWLTGDQ